MVHGEMILYEACPCQSQVSDQTFNTLYVTVLDELWGAYLGYSGANDYGNGTL